MNTIDLAQQLNVNVKKFADGGAMGNGLYVASDPFVSSNHGETLLSLKVKKGVKVCVITSNGHFDNHVLPFEDLYVKFNCPATLYPWRLGVFGDKALAIYDASILDLSQISVLQTHVTLDHTAPDISFLRSNIEPIPLTQKLKPEEVLTRYKALIALFSRVQWPGASFINSDESLIFHIINGDIWNGTLKSAISEASATILKQVNIQNFGECAFLPLDSQKIACLERVIPSEFGRTFTTDSAGDPSSGHPQDWEKVFLAINIIKTPVNAWNFKMLRDAVRREYPGMDFARSYMEYLREFQKSQQAPTLETWK